MTDPDDVFDYPGRSRVNFLEVIPGIVYFDVLNVPGTDRLSHINIAVTRGARTPRGVGAWSTLAKPDKRGKNRAKAELEAIRDACDYLLQTIEWTEDG